MHTAIIYKMVKNQSPDEWEVESILEKKGSGKNARYKIKWKGYDLEDCTWEPLSNLESCKDAIVEFENKLEKKTKSKAKPNAEVKQKVEAKSKAKAKTEAKDKSEAKPKAGGSKTKNREITKAKAGGSEMEKDVERIKGVFIGKDSKVYGEVEWKKKGRQPERYPILELNRTFPNLMCDFYYNHFSFVQKPRVEFDIERIE